VSSPSRRSRGSSWGRGLRTRPARGRQLEQELLLQCGQQLDALLEGLFSDGKLRLSPQEEYDIRAEGYVMEMPQSGEQIVGRDKMRAFQEAYPNPPDAQVRRIVGSGDVFVVEARADYGAEVAFVANVVEFKDGRIAKETRATTRARSRRLRGERSGSRPCRERPRAGSGQVAAFVCRGAELAQSVARDLPRTRATFLLRQGAHSKIVQERLGPANVGIALDIYSHVAPHMRADAAEKIDAGMRKAMAG